MSSESPKTLTNKLRRQWWNRLTPEQKENFIEKRQAQKAEYRKLNPPKELMYNPQYPWMTEGVNDTNRKKWLANIKKKNPWLSVVCVLAH